MGKLNLHYLFFDFLKIQERLPLFRFLAEKFGHAGKPSDDPADASVLEGHIPLKYPNNTRTIGKVLKITDGKAAVKYDNGEYEVVNTTDLLTMANGPHLFQMGRLRNFHFSNLRRLYTSVEPIYRLLRKRLKDTKR